MGSIRRASAARLDWNRRRRDGDNIFNFPGGGGEECQWHLRVNVSGGARVLQRLGLLRHDFGKKIEQFTDADEAVFVTVSLARQPFQQKPREDAVPAAPIFSLVAALILT